MRTRRCRRPSRVSGRRWLLAIGLLVGLLEGCTALTVARPLFATQPPLATGEKAVPSHPQHSGNAAASSENDSSRRSLSGDHWVRAEDWRADRQSLPPRLRESIPSWRYRWGRAGDPPVTATLLQTVGSEPRLRPLLNAHVERQEPGDLAGLQRLVRDESAAESTRAAAAEAWAVLVAATATAESGWSEIGHAVADPTLPLAVRGELLRRIGVAPQRVPALVEAVATASPLLPAAVDACVAAAATATSDRDFPEGLWEHRRHRDPAVRIGVLRWAAARRHPEAGRWLRRQMSDVDPAVRVAAVETAGRLPGDRNAIALLEEASESPSERSRAAAIRGRFIADPAAPLRGGGDDSALVRREVARLTGDARTLQRLIIDDDRDVQRFALASSQRLTPQHEAAVLLKAVEGGMLETRQAAATRLRTHFAVAGNLAVGEPPRARSIAVARAAHAAGLRRSVAEARRLPSHDEAIAAAFEQLATDANAAAAWDVLAGLTTDDLPTVEAALRTEPVATTDWPRLWDELLPAVRDDFAAFAKLRVRSPRVRISGAWELTAWSQSRSLSPLILSRLPAVLSGEQNASVWRGVLEAITHENDPQLAEVLREALRSPWDDVKAIACQAVGRQSDPGLAASLRPLLTDSSETTQLAAIDAIGRCGNPALLADEGNRPGLRSMQADLSPAVRSAVLRASFRLGEPEAESRLLRNLHAGDRRTKLDALAVLAESPRQELADAIFTLAWTERDDRVRSAELRLLATVDPLRGNWDDDWTDRQKLEHWRGDPPSPEPPPERRSP